MQAGDSLSIIHHKHSMKFVTSEKNLQIANNGKNMTGKLAKQS